MTRLLLALLLAACSATNEDGSTDERFTKVHSSMHGPRVLRDRADGRCHAIYRTGDGVAYLGVVPCEVP
jgi:hypothetical protein